MGLRKMMYQQTKYAINALTDLLGEYQAIGTVEECRAAVEKQKEKEAIGNIKVEPIIDENGAYIDAKTFCYLVCPCCGNQVGIDEELDNYCSNCGQKLKMEDEE